MKNLTKTVYDTLTEYYNGTLETGMCKTLDVTTDSVLLPMETSVFTTFTQANYDAIREQLVNGAIDIATNESADSVTGLPVKLVDVTEIN